MEIELTYASLLQSELGQDIFSKNYNSLEEMYDELIGRLRENNVKGGMDLQTKYVCFAQVNEEDIIDHEPEQSEFYVGLDIEGILRFFGNYDEFVKNGNITSYNVFECETYEECFKYCIDLMESF